MSVIRPPSVSPPSIDRRRFLEIGAAASLTASLTAALAEVAGAATLASGGLRARAREAGPLKLHTVIYDERFEAARRFGEALRSHRVPARSIRGDVTQLWYAWLHPLWKREPAPIAGLTAYAAMFCLERLAWDQRLRMIHCDVGNMNTAGNAADSAGDWPIEQAALIARGIGAGSLAPSRRGAAADAFAASAGGPLHFWIIAPQAELAPLTTDLTV
jgi:hypothetical protein